VLVIVGLVLSGVTPTWAAVPLAKSAPINAVAPDNEPVQQPAPPVRDRLLALDLTGPQEVAPGDRLTLSLRAWNIGRAVLKDVTVQLYEATGTMTGGVTIALPPLAADEVVTKSVTLEVTAQPGTRLWVRAEATGGIGGTRRGRV